jgi:aspartyl-tRNA(Asn)/glutamyl-tRNA(Gln) amidotransferase subunit A
MSDLMDLSAVELAALVRAGDASPSDCVEAALARIDERNESLNAFVHVCAERALGDARDLEKRMTDGERTLPLAGVPLGVKDLEEVAGLPCTYGSVPLRDNVAERDSVQVERLRAAGAIVVGKTNTPEFGYTGFTRNRVFGTTRNPWNTERTPGGSSGGSAAALAGRMVPLVTASDGGGSTRIPACYTGAFGIKPSFGRIPLGPLDGGSAQWADTIHLGPITRSTADAAAFIDAACGYHSADANSLPHPGFSYLESIDDLPTGLRVGFSRDLGYARVQKDVLREVEGSVAELAALGFEIEELDLKLPDLGNDWGMMAGAEIFGVVAPLVEGHEEELGRSFWQGLQLASRLDPAGIARIQRKRAELNAALGALFEDYDLLVTPQLPTEAFAASGPPPSGVDGRDFDAPMHAVAFTYPFNMSGHPAASLRAGMTDAGLPAGLQVVAERHRDELVLQTARALELSRPAATWPAFPFS